MTFPTRPIGKTDLRVPVLGFGGAALGGLFSKVDGDDARNALSAALDAGQTYVDTAPFYGFGRSERVVGDGLRGRNYVLSTKVGRLLLPGAHEDPASMGWPDALPFHPVYDYSYDGVMRSIDHSFQRLGLDRIDIAYVHDIGEATHGADNAAHLNDLKSGGYRALQELRDQGVISAIGIGVNEAAMCMTALDFGDWDVFLLAGRYTLLEQAPLDDLLPRCLERGTSIVVGGPFNSGVLVGGDTFDYAEVPAEIATRVQQLKAVADAHDVPLPAAALQFPMAHPAIASIIPGQRNVAEVQDALAWASTDIPAAFWDDLKAQGLLHEAAPTPTTNPFKE